MPHSWNEIKSRALAFSKHWADAGNEDAQAKPFLIDFFEIFGITDKRIASFEHAVKKYGGELNGPHARKNSSPPPEGTPAASGRPSGGRGYVDLFWPGILLVEMKSRGKNLDRAHAQAMDYFPGIAERDLPRFVLVCDFARFRLYDLTENLTHEFVLAELHKHVRLFGFIAGYQTQIIKPQDPINIKAAERMGRLHDQLKAIGYEGRPLELYLVRLLFCLFAEDTGIFEKRQFQDYIEQRTGADGSDLAHHLATLFHLLNTPVDKRLKNLDEQLAAFPYINGKLFEAALPPASFDAAMRESLLDLCGLDWSRISPAIFGSLFQSIMDDKARRNLGAHYTSEENILKLIKPLFLDALRAEFEKIKKNRNKLFEFHKKLRGLRFFDPACGCGNFLVITYRELRLLELDVLRAAHVDGQQMLDIHQLIAVDVDQFYGIEIEDFPAQIAQVALWLTDHQMNLKVSEEFGAYFVRIPLTHSATIMHGNALQLDWNAVLPAPTCAYVLGNPPFVGAKFMDDAQREDTRAVFAGIANAGLLDFVAAWYVKAARYMTENPAMRAAFVSTNSITQGEQVGALWSWMLAQGIRIHFAHRTFSWSNEARGKAAVHCVIVGFGLGEVAEKTIFEYEDIKGDAHAVKAANINPYLVDAPDMVLPRRSKPLCDVPEIGIGNKPIDGGHYLFTPEDKAAFLKLEPASEPYFRRWLGATEFINGIERWYLWLGYCPPDKLRLMPEAMKRVQAVRNFRLASSSLPTQKLADTPTRFHVENIPDGDYLIFPRHSSESRRFLPIGFGSQNVLVGDACLVSGTSSVYHFGILSSTMQNAWIRSTCGRIKSDFRFSAAIVYNNFPWPTPSDKQRAAIEAAAQAVLDARAAHPGASLADLYDPLTMPPDLVKAHQKLDAAVDAAYGYKGTATDAARVAFLFSRYQQLSSLLSAKVASKAGSCDDTGHVTEPNPADRSETPAVARPAPGRRQSARRLSGQGTGLHGELDGAGKRARGSAASANPADSTRPLDATRELATAAGPKPYSEVAESLAENVARCLGELLDSDPDALAITPAWLRDIHQRLAGDLFPDWAGCWRTTEVQVGTHFPPPPHDVPVHVKNFCLDLEVRMRHLGDAQSVAELLAWVDWRFQWIHPFKDFNGRVGRILLVALAYRLGLPPIDPAGADGERQAYFAALRAADTGDLRALTGIWLDRL